jgi:putative protease
MIKKKKIIKAKKSKKEKPPAPKKAGKVTHYFSEIKVAVVKLSCPLKIGDSIRIIGGKDTDFNQKVKSMQVDHKSVKTAKKGKTIGLKTDKKARDGYFIYKA